LQALETFFVSELLIQNLIMNHNRIHEVNVLRLFKPKHVRNFYFPNIGIVFTLTKIRFCADVEKSDTATLSLTKYAESIFSRLVGKRSPTRIHPFLEELIERVAIRCDCLSHPIDFLKN